MKKLLQKTLNISTGLPLRKLMKKRSGKLGAAPGTLSYVGKQKTETVNLTLFSYNEDVCEKTEQVADLGGIKTILEKLEEPYKQHWLNIDGLHDVEMIQVIGEALEIHPLILEDILNTDQRPKVEEHEATIFIVAKMIYFPDKIINAFDGFVSEQVSLVLQDNVLLTFQEQPEDIFSPIRQRLHKSVGRLRKAKTNHLMVQLLDTIVDHYFTVLEKQSDSIERMETEIFKRDDDSVLQEVYLAKREMISFRKSVWPMRDLIHQLIISGHSQLTEDLTVYLRDIHDHAVLVVDTLETFRELLNSIVDTHLSLLSHRMNNVMKVLTIIATIFIPLTFIAGIYGMNFENMPELHWENGYFIVLAVMAVMTIGMLAYFKKLRWL